MKFKDYLEIKRFFILFVLISILFITILIYVSFEGESLISNIIYINLGYILLTTVYLIIGYFYHNTLYKEMKQLNDSTTEPHILLLPKPQDKSQQLFINIIEKIQHTHVKELEKLQNEKTDYQDFIMTWVHEAKLPITASRMILKSSDGKTVDYLIDKLEDEIIKIDNYVEQALYYSRIDSFSKDYFITDVLLNQVVKDSVKKYSKLFIHKHIKFTMWDSDEFVYSDYKWLGFVIDQILTNSLKYTDEGGIISINFEENDNEKLLTIHDTGIGIKPEDINRVFDKSFTGSVSRNHSKSTGIGLYLAKQMVLKLGHNISIESEESKYTNVTLHFPKLHNYYDLKNYEY